MIWAALFGTCIIYAVLLERLHMRYIPDWLIFTVIVGNGFICEALFLIERFVRPLSAGLVVETMAVAAIPIAAWQGWQKWQRVQEARRDGTDPRRQETT